MQIKDYYTIEDTHTGGLLCLGHAMPMARPVVELDFGTFPYAFAYEPVANPGEHIKSVDKYKITVLTNMQCVPVEMNGKTFSPIIVQERHSGEVSSYYFILQGTDRTGKCFEKAFDHKGKDICTSFVFAMTLISAVGNVEEAHGMWNWLHGEKMPAEAGLLLSKVERIHTLAESIVKEKPYMRMFFQKGLERMVTALKQKLERLEWLR